MTKSVYVIGGAGTGKSTWMADLFTVAGVDDIRKLEDFHVKANPKNDVTLRGHRIEASKRAGLYIGVARDQFPGTDGLDRATSPVGEEWLQIGGAKEFDFLVAEGNTLGTRRFLTALHEHTDLLLILLTADEFVRELRFLERGSNQSLTFVMGTATRSANLLRDMEKIGVKSLTIDSSDSNAWQSTLEAARNHILVG